MTETTVKNDLPTNDLPGAVEAFVLSWGDLGSQWGVNRSVAQIHAYLYLQDEPVTAEHLAQVFSMARSNVSNSLKELLGWDLIRRVPVRGDRRDHFVAETDVWEMASRIAAGRKRREFDPALATLEGCVTEASQDERIGTVQRERLAAMRDFMVRADDWYGQMTALPTSKRDMLLRLGATVARFLPQPKPEPKQKEQ